MRLAAALLLALLLAAPAPAQVLVVIDPSPDGSDPQEFAGDGGLVFFEAGDGVHGRELWVTDGTAAGTHLVKDFVPGPDDADTFLLDYAIDYDGALLFQAEDPDHGRELWRSDGTEAGTVLVEDINPGDSHSAPSGFVHFDDLVYFGADGGGQNGELWRTDGTAVGTQLAVELMPGPSGGYPSGFVILDGRLLFSALEPSSSTNFELWESDGSSASMVKDIYPGGNARPGELTVFDGHVYFQAADGAHGRELWRSDGTEAGTVLVKDILPGTGNGSPIFVTACGGTLYFRADDGTHGDELWVTDGSEPGTRLIRDIHPSDDARPTSFVCLDGILLFSANDGASGEELWRSDGTEAGTYRVKDVNPGVVASLPRDLVAMHSLVYFTADDGTYGDELWQTDGTDEGTVLAVDLLPGTDSSFPDELYASGDLLTFGAEIGFFDDELWLFRAPLGRTCVEVDGDGAYDFPGTALGLTFAGTTPPRPGARGVGGHTVCAEFFHQVPANVDGIAEPHVGPWRWVVRADPGFAFSSAEARFRQDEIPNAPQEPSGVAVYRRGIPGGGTFGALPTSYDPGDGVIVATGLTALGEFVFAASEPIANEPAAEAPSGFSLSAAYPNPFNPSTVFTLDLPEAGAVTVAVFDALGRRVAVLHDGPLAAGTHALRFDAVGLPSGVYAVRASGAAEAVSQRVTLVR